MTNSNPVHGPGWVKLCGNPVPGNVYAALDALGIDYDDSILGEALALCPNPEHDDTKPSWSVNTDNGMHHCFACGFKGNFVTLVEKYLGISRAEAVVWVRSKGGIERARKFGAKRNTLSTKSDTTSNVNEAMIALFVDPPTSMLTSRLLQLDKVKELSIRWDSNTKEWITPIRDPYTYELLGYQTKGNGRVRNFPVGVKKSKALFGIELFQGGRLILVESPLDVARLLSVGITGAVASFGARVSDRQLDIIIDVADELLIAMDNDKAGFDITKKLLGEFKRLPVKVFNYGNAEYGSDPGSLEANQLNFGVRKALRGIHWEPIQIPKTG